MVIPEKAFAGLTVMTIAYLLQLPQNYLNFLSFLVKYNIKHLLGLQLGHLFEYAKLAKVVRQINRLFIVLLNKV